MGVRSRVLSVFHAVVHYEEVKEIGGIAEATVGLRGRDDDESFRDGRNAR